MCVCIFYFPFFFFVNYIFVPTKIINQRMSEFKDHKSLINDVNDTDDKKKVTIFLDILLEKYLRNNNDRYNNNNIGDNEKIRPENLRSEVNTFILGGHDTTAMALTFTILMVGQHPDVQIKIIEELDLIFAGLLPSVLLKLITICILFIHLGDNQKEINIEDLRKMRYLEMCIKETLRLYPSIQLIGRQLSEPLKLSNGKIIPTNASCYVPILSIHQDPKYYPNPTQFKPERFSPENKLNSAHHPYAYIPFSAGPRNCIGQKYAMLELKYVLSSLLRRFRIHSYTNPNHIIKELTPVIKPMTNIKVHFEAIE